MKHVKQSESKLSKEQKQSSIEYVKVRMNRLVFKVAFQNLLFYST